MYVPTAKYAKQNFVLRMLYIQCFESYQQVSLFLIQNEIHQYSGI